jgi:hypothetical protein
MSRASHRRLTWALLIVAGLVTVLIGAGWFLSVQKPAWVVELDAKSPALQRLAADVENGLTTLMTEPRVLEKPWSMVLRQDAAGAWLACRLRAWVEHQFGDGAWPGAVRSVQCTIESGTVSLSFLGPKGERGRVSSVTFTPTVDAEGRLWLKGLGFRAGLLPVPRSTVISAMTGAGGADDGPMKELMSVLAGENAWSKPMVVNLADGRRVRVLSLTCEEGLLIVRCVTERAR